MNEPRTQIILGIIGDDPLRRTGEDSLVGQTAAAMFCPSQRKAFGPVFHNIGEAERFIHWCLPEDPRVYQDHTLDGLVREFRDWEQSKRDQSAVMSKPRLGRKLEIAAEMCSCQEGDICEICRPELVKETT